MNSFTPAHVIPPWETIQEALEYELSLDLGLSDEDFNALKSGELRITPELAVKLEDATKLNASLLLTLDKNFVQLCTKTEKN